MSDQKDAEKLHSKDAQAENERLAFNGKKNREEHEKTPPKMTQQMWDHAGPGSAIIHRDTKQCMTKTDNTIRLSDCDSTSEDQKWKFDHYYDPPQ